jgi:uncharacterized protein YdhG (YjbR/CyaY superfamily)
VATTKTTTDPRVFLETVAPAGRRRDALALLDLMREATGLEPRLSGSIVAFGEYAYEYDSGRKGTAPAAAFSPRKAATVVYLLDGIAYHEAALAKLGPHKTGVGCLYLEDLSKTDLRVLKAIVRTSFKTLTKGVFGNRARDAAEVKAPKKSTGGSAAGPIDAYLARIENATARATLTQLRVQLRELLPTATETISYDMPAFRLPNGKVAAGFAFFGKSCGYYPHSGGVIPKLGALLDGYKATKGGITFPPDAPLPKKFVSALVRTRLAEIAEKDRASNSARATRKRTTTHKVASPAAATKKPRIFAMSFASVYPLYVQKAEKKGRTRAEVDEVIGWLTGYRGTSLLRAIDDKRDLEAFFGEAPRWNPKAALITGVVCGVRIEDVDDPLMQKIRCLDKLVDELAKGKKMTSILRP